MITRKVDMNDSQAGFVHNWILKLSRKADLKVICLSLGSFDLPEVEVFSLGKEKGKNRLREFINFYRGVFRYIRQVDGVFCHQNPEYTILVFPLAFLFRKKIVCWYAHKEVNWRVRLMSFFASSVVTSSEAGFQIKTPKKIVVGQGIDTDLFVPGEKGVSNKLRIISVGRISPIKGYDVLIKAVSLLKIPFELKIVGAAGTEEQKKHLEELKNLAASKGLMDIFVGGVSQSELIRLYQSSDLAVNLCPTGAPDKAGLEAMACGLPLLACNHSYDFGPYTQLLFREGDAHDLAAKISSLNDFELIGRYLRQQVVEKHNLDKLLERIVQCF